MNHLSFQVILLLVFRFVVFFSLVPSATSFATMSENPSKNSKLDEAAAFEDSENLRPWAARWKDNRIGFHLSDVNPWLQTYADQLLNINNDDEKEKEDESTCSNTRIFVPLCGKTVDMAYLVQQKSAEVVGVEGIRKAFEEFAEEQPELKVKADDTETQDGFERFQGTKITLLKGDFFDLDASKTNGKFGAIFDRASMVAIDPSLRPQYVDVIGKLLAPGGRILLITLERRGSEEGMKMGPPFSIPESTVRELYEGLDWVESVTLLSQEDQLETTPKDKERYPDLDKLLQLVFLIQAKA